MPAAAAPQVLLVVNSLRYGGTERMIERMTTHLHDSGKVRYTLCTLEDEGPIGAQLRARGVEVIALGLGGGMVRQVVGGAHGLRRLLRRRHFDLIHSFLYRSHCASRLARVGLRPRVPLISSERCLGDNRARATLWVNRLTGRMSDRILAVSEAVAERAIERDGIPRERVAVVPNGIEPQPSRPRQRSRLRKALRLGDDAMLFLFLGRLHPEKGPDLLIEALDLLRREEPEGWRVVFVGDGGQRSELESRVNRLGLRDRVFLAGGRRRVGPWLEACDALILPSREEGMPVAALEAMMCGRAVIATQVGGSPEVVLDGETGITVPAEDAAALARALVRLLRDPGLTRRLGAQGRDRGRKEFSIDRMTDGTLRQYEQMMPRSEAGAKRVAALTARAE